MEAVMAITELLAMKELWKRGAALQTGGVLGAQFVAP